VPFLSIFLLGLAVSFDGFGAGFAYGVRRLHIPAASIVIICLSSSFSIFLSMKAGSLVATLFTLKTASFIGGLMLVGVGVAIVFQSLQGRQNHQPVSGEQKQKSSSGLTMVPRVMREPAQADFDCSGAISGKEAVILGVALAMDAFGAGFGAAMMGFAPVTTALTVGVTKLILLSSGVLLGKKYASNISGERAAIVSGAVLMVLGIAHLC
jgi:putative sporulation protein YtaF